jgi:hypothetical protein
MKKTDRSLRSRSENRASLRSARMLDGSTIVLWNEL